MILKIRDLLQQSTAQLWDSLQPGNYILEFDNKIQVETNHKKILLSSYFWDMFRAYPNITITEKHFIDAVLKGKPYGNDTHIKMLQIIYWDVSDAYNLLTPASRDNLTHMCYIITNNIYNDLSCRLSEYVSSIDILDMLQIIKHPPIAEVLDNLDPSDASIQNSYDVILRELNTSPLLDNNNLAFATRAKMINSNQVVQCLGPRGRISEVDGWIMPVPILRSFFKGMRNMYNLILESRTAAKHLFFSEAPLQDGEYFARRLQLIAMTVEYIARPSTLNGVITDDSMHDCGSNDYLLWRVRGPEVVNGYTVYGGDLDLIVGKWYLDEETNTLKLIKATDAHLIDKTLKLRTVLGCKHPDPHGVCSVCFGQLENNIPEHANIGHVCSATVTQKITQSILSTKHLISSATAGNVVLSKIASEFFKVGRKGESLYILPAWKNKKVCMVISSKEAFGLTDINLVDNIADINPTRVSAVEFTEMIVGDEDNHVRHPICISHENRKSIFSSEFLQYLKLHGWCLDENGNFVIGFDHWDFTKPVFMIPLKEYSYSNHAREIAKIIESRISDISEREKPDSPKATLIELFELVNSRLRVNIACLEVIIYAMMCYNQSEGLYGLARNSSNSGLGVRGEIIKNRSLSPAIAYQGQNELFCNPRSFFNEDRGDSVFDAFVTPHEVVEHYRR